MASNNKNNVLLVRVVVFILLVAFSSERVSIKASKSEIRSVCSAARDPKFCLKFFGSKHEAAKADLRGLAELTVDSAGERAEKTLKQIHKLLEKASDHRSKEVYTSCSENFEDAIEDISEALKALKVDDADTFNYNISAVMSHAETCKDDLNINVSPNPSSILEEIEYLDKVSNIALVISHKLSK